MNDAHDTEQMDRYCHLRQVREYLPRERKSIVHQGRHNQNKVWGQNKFKSKP